MNCGLSESETLRLLRGGYHIHTRHVSKAGCRETMKLSSSWLSQSLLSMVDTGLVKIRRPADSPLDTFTTASPRTSAVRTAPSKTAVESTRPLKLASNRPPMQWRRRYQANTSDINSALESATRTLRRQTCAMLDQIIPTRGLCI